jgi:transposase InsO family protein
MPVYGRDFRRRTQRIGIDGIATPIHAPKANAIIERVIGTLRRECLDHLIVLDEQHLRSVLAQYGVLQPRAPASHAWTADAGTQATPHDWSDPVATGVERAPSRVQARRLNMTDICRLTILRIVAY